MSKGDVTVDNSAVEHCAIYGNDRVASAFSGIDFAAGGVTNSYSKNNTIYVTGNVVYLGGILPFNFSIMLFMSSPMLFISNINEFNCPAWSAGLKSAMLTSNEVLNEESKLTLISFS